MAHYKEHFFSVVKFIKGFNQEAASTLGIAAPAFVNLDAHTDLHSLPNSDFLSVLNFGALFKENSIEIIFKIGVSTYDDPDMTRHVDIMDLLTPKLFPGKTIPIFLATDIINPNGWMVSMHQLIVSPPEHGDIRSMQLVETHFLSGYSGQV